MNNTEKVLMGLLSLVLLAVIVVAIVMLVKKNDSGSPPPSPSPPPGVEVYKLVENLSGPTLVPGPDKPFYYPQNPQWYGGGEISGYKVGAQKNLVSVNNDGSTHIKAGTPANGNVPSVLMMSKQIYDHGLFVMQVKHIPSGQGVWPAWWLMGKTTGNNKWALNGEIDIIEQVNNEPTNHSTLHTNTKPGDTECNQAHVPGISSGGKCGGATRLYSGTGVIQGKTDCGYNSQQQCFHAGCGVTFPHGSGGDVFNQSVTDAGNNGGVYACELTTDGRVTVWFFAPGNVPRDLTEGSSIVDPSKWKDLATKTVEFQKCPGSFKQMQMIVNTAFCGDWAGSTFDHTKNSKEHCNNFVLDTSKSKNLENAYWDINWIRVYQQK